MHGYRSGRRLHQATLLEVVRCAMTLPLPHFRQRNRLTNWATGVPGFIPKRTSSRSEIKPRCWHLKHCTKMMGRGLFIALRITSQPCAVSLPSAMASSLPCPPSTQKYSAASSSRRFRP
jgi:hypothetical protein